jgi:hypothetical protein
MWRFEECEKHFDLFALDVEVDIRESRLELCRWDQFVTCVTWRKNVFLEHSHLRAEYLVSLQEIVDVGLERRCQEWLCLVSLSDNCNAVFQDVHIVNLNKTL